MSMQLSQGIEEQAERAWRLRAAFAEAGIGSMAALEAFVSRLYRHETEGLAHLHRVARVARRIGEEMEIPAEEIDDLERAALLHDLGRFVLPDPPPLPDVSAIIPTPTDLDSLLFRIGVLLPALTLTTSEPITGP